MTKYCVAYSSGFSADSIYRDFRDHGETIAEIVASLGDKLPARFADDGVVCLNGDPVPRDVWHLVRPKASEYMPLAVTLHLAPQGSVFSGGGGGAGGGKSLLKMFSGFGGGMFGPLGSIFVNVLASLALRALSKPPKKPKGDSKKDRTSSLEGNALEPGDPIPRVVGTHQVFPPFISQPLVEIIGEDEYVEAVLALAGPHRLEDIKAGDVDVTSSQDIQVETREGWPTDTATTLVTRQSFTENAQLQMSAHDIEPDSFTELNDDVNPLNSLPVWHTFTTRQSPDEFWISLNFPSGLYDGDNPSRYMAFPLRIRMRQVGSPTWINLPVLMLTNRRTRPIKGTLVFKWTAAAWTPVRPPRDLIFTHAYRMTPTQGPAPSSTLSADTPLGYWRADNYFSRVNNATFSSNSLLHETNWNAASEVINLNLYQDRAEVHLNTATFPKGIWEISVKRGYAVDTSNFNRNNFETNGSRRDLFWYEDTGNPQIRQSTENRNSDCYINRASSIWYEHPAPVPNNLAVIAVKAKNRQLPPISVKASGYVQDWNGTAWANWTTTSNPAPHYRDVLAGSLNLDPLPTSLLDSTSLVNWRTRCTAKGYQANFVADGKSTTQVLETLASCGYARPYNSEVWGVIEDNDRSAEAPVQVFTPRNSANFKFSKAFNRPLDGLRVAYRDKDRLYNEHQFIKYDTGGSVTNPRLEQIDYEGLVTQAEADKRAAFDLAQIRLRATTYTLDADAESIVCRNGDLVAVQNDVLSSQAGFSRIAAKTVFGPNITGFTLYEPVTFGAGPNGIAIRRLDGTISVHLVTQANVTTNTVTLAATIADTVAIDEDCLIAIGPSASEYRRLIVTNIEPSQDFTATLTLVDEAPALQSLI